MGGSLNLERWYINEKISMRERGNGGFEIWMHRAVKLRLRLGVLYEVSQILICGYVIYSTSI